MSKQRSWDQLVLEGRQAAQARSGAQWKLGDLSLEAEPIGRPGPELGSRRNNSRTARLRKFAAEVGVAYKTLATYRHTANKWPVDKRVAGASFWAHTELAPDPQRFKLLTRLVAEAEKKGRALNCNDVFAAKGKVRIHTARRVAVHEHERRPPGTVSPKAMKTLAAKIKEAETKRADAVAIIQPSALDAVLRRMTVEEIGEHIERCWAIIEEKTLKEAA